MIRKTGAVLSRLPYASRLTLAGLSVGIVGLVIQTIADPAKFVDAQSWFRVPFPPGILFILVAAVLMVLTSRWRAHPVFAILIGVWIVGVGFKFLLPNLTSPNVGTVAGNAVMALGLLAAIVTGIVSIASRRGRRRTAT